MNIIGKTDLTKQLERDIWDATIKQGVFGAFEVTIGFNTNKYGRVDYMTYDTKGIWRCYEIKVSKSDFHSKAKKTFVANYNYFVLPHELYEEVKDEIPKHIGVYCRNGLYKKAKKQKLLVDEKILKDSMIRSLYREFEKQYKSKDDTLIKKYQRKFNRLKREKDRYSKQYNDLMKIGIKNFGDKWLDIINKK